MVKLEEFLEKGGNWERKKTSVPGLSVIKMPPYGRRGAQLAAEANPVDESGKALKKRGLIIVSIEELEAFRKILQDEKTSELLRKIDSITTPEKPGEDLIEL